MNAGRAGRAAGRRWAIAALLALAGMSALAQTDTRKNVHAPVHTNSRPPDRTAANGSALLAVGAIAHANGEQIFRHVCQGCHMADATGARGAAAYPALAGDLRLASARYAAAVVLFGRRDMPSFSAETDLTGFDATLRIGLDDAQIAEVVNYVRSHFGNHYADMLGATEVKAMHVPNASP